MLGRDPLPEAAANKPMVLTPSGYVALGEVAPQKRLPSWIVKDNPYHDARGRFTTADGARDSSDHEDHELPSKGNEGSSESYQHLAITGTLIDKRYDEVIGITHCTYSTPLGTFTIEHKGYLACPDVWPYPF